MDKFIKGMDVSTLPEQTALGANYYDEGKEADALEILKKYGANSLRPLDPKSSGLPTDLHPVILHLYMYKKTVKSDKNEKIFLFFYSDGNNRTRTCIFHIHVLRTTYSY